MLRRKVTNTKPRVRNENYLGGGQTGTTYATQQEYAEAVVVSVIVNDDSDDYAVDGYNVGAIKFRFLSHDIYKNETDLNYAFPIESNIQEYPLLNEIVLIYKALGRWYYTRKLNISNLVTHQAYFGIDEELNPIDMDSLKNRNVSTTVGATKSISPKKKKDILGNTFDANPDVKRLRHDEGDLIVEGRSGHSLRFGTNIKNLAPNIKIRVGQGPKVKPNIDSMFALVKEDVNDDKSSLYIISDEIVDLEYSTVKNKIHRASIKDFPRTLSGSQVIINSDRIVFNTKLDKIMGHSGNGIHWTTNKDFTVDADGNYLSTISRNSEIFVAGYSKGTSLVRHSIVSPKVYIGSNNNEAQPLVLGASLANFLEELISIFVKNATTLILTTGSPFGPSPMNPVIGIKLSKLLYDVRHGKFASFNSKVAYTVKDSQVKGSAPTPNGKVLPIESFGPNTSQQKAVELTGMNAQSYQVVVDTANQAKEALRKSANQLLKDQKDLVKQQVIIIAAGAVPLALPKSALNTVAQAKGVLSQINKLKNAKDYLNMIKKSVDQIENEAKANMVAIQQRIDNEKLVATNDAQAEIDKVKSQIDIVRGAIAT